MQLIKDGRIINDPWTYVEDGEDLPADRAPIVSMKRWIAERDVLMDRNTPIGVVLDSGDLPEEIETDIHRFDVIALTFPSFKDGRAYSSARLLRDRFGYEGELRAVGNVLRDQFQFMARCGFDAVEAQKSSDAAAWAETLGEIGVVYQAAADGRLPATELRHPNAGIWAC